MEIVEIIYQSFDSFENSIEVEFLDENENVFSDKIKYHYFVDFGYGDDDLDVTDFDEDSTWESFIDDPEFDSDVLIEFLTEYYNTFPDMIPE